MKFQSSHSKNAYLTELRQSFGSIFDFWDERFTGFVIGNFFCVTHHCDYEWNRRINGETNTAIGFVKKLEDGCNVHFFTVKGELRPQGMFMLICLQLLIFIFCYAFDRDPISPSHIPIIAGVILAVSLFVAGVSAFLSWLTENGQAGYRSLLSLLLDPMNPYENL